ncbi:MAG: hypothetical protein ACI81S_000552 [Sphingobacteriales bacterium]|jgi:hypothetical protein
MFCLRRLSLILLQEGKGYIIFTFQALNNLQHELHGLKNTARNY